MKPMPGGNRVLKRAQTVRGGCHAALSPRLSVGVLRRARRARRIWIGALLFTAGATATVFQSCSGAPGAAPKAGLDGKALVAGKGDSAPPKGKPSPKSAAGNTVKAADDPSVEKAAKDLEVLLDKLSRDEEIAGPRPESSKDVDAPAPRPAAGPSRPSRAASRESTDRPPVTSGPSGNGGQSNVAASLDESLTPKPPGEPKPPAPAVSPARESKSVAERRAELTGELASLLRPVAADGSDSMDALAPLLALETVQPGAATADIEAAIKSLTPQEAATVRAVRDLLRKLGAEPALAVDPKGLSRELAAHLDRLAAQAPTEGLALGTVAMCSRVESFGRYSPLPSSRLVAGRVNSAIIYVEVQNFIQRPAYEAPADPGAGDPDGLVVQLIEEIELWHDDGTRQWRAPAATIRDSSRTRRRDFFLVQRIDLPSNLSVGKYNLKVTVRDAGAEGTPQTEAMIPIEIIADPRLIIGAGGAHEPALNPDPEVGGKPAKKSSRTSDVRRDASPATVKRSVPSPRPVTTGRP